MMSVQQFGVNLFLSRLKTSTSQVSFTNSLDLLQSKLVTQGVKHVVNLVEKLEQFTSSVALDNTVKLSNVNQNNGDFSFIV